MGLVRVLAGVGIADGASGARWLDWVVGWGHEMRTQPVGVRDGVHGAVDGRGAALRVVLITKGILGDRGSKVERGGLARPAVLERGWTGGGVWEGGGARRASD